MPGSVLAGLALDATLTGGTQRSVVVDASNNAIGSQENGGIRGLAVTQSGTYYDLVASNSSTAQLAASATFTGTIEYSANQQAISMLCVSDQPITLTLREFIDEAGTRQTSIRTFNVTAGTGFSRCVQLNGNYFRISAQNTGASTTTTFALDVALGTLQSQTQSGNLPVSINEVDAAVTVPTRVADQTAAISINANATSSGSITGLSQAATVTIQLTGTWTATLQVQLTRDGTNWVNVTGSNSIINVATGAYIASGNLTANGVYQMCIAGVAGVRVITTAYTPSNVVTGTLAVTAAPALMAIEGVPAVTVSSGTITTVTTCSTVTTVGTVNAASLHFPQSITDVSSAVLSSTTTSSTITPTAGISYIVVVPVTAISGTPVLDLNVEESDDSGTNWRLVYSFPRISGTGIYRSPPLMFAGNRVRYVQTLTGTTSFTRAINRLQCSHPADPYRQRIDRTVSLTTLNSTTPTLDVQGCDRVQMSINIGAATTPPTLTLEASDDNGTTWYTLGSPLAAVASSTVSMSVADVSPQMIRARVSSAGNTVTAGYVLIRGY